MNLLELQRENEALKLENEALKLKLFWKQHSYEIMEHAMCRANEVEGGPMCSCLTCQIRRGRYNPETENERCTFKPWFEQVLQEHDMSIGRGLPDVPLWDVWFGGSVDESRAQVLDDGQHFSLRAKQDWSRWTYGSKLWKATSVCDPELAKLERLLHYLNTFGTEE